LILINLTGSGRAPELSMADGVAEARGFAPRWWVWDVDCCSGWSGFPCQSFWSSGFWAGWV